MKNNLTLTFVLQCTDYLLLISRSCLLLHMDIFFIHPTHLGNAVNVILLRIRHYVLLLLVSGGNILWVTLSLAWPLLLLMINCSFASHTEVLSSELSVTWDKWFVNVQKWRRKGLDLTNWPNRLSEQDSRSIWRMGKKDHSRGTFNHCWLYKLFHEGESGSS